ncbi:MAG: response regulator [Deltaproteobacteria bacterium]|nr:response regulator [Deltaproteobacteria bacterium]NCP03607.1 response regulator [Deltaproteobacteria bacterium]NCP78522.1 response regulator [Desulfuromonadales bacterium]
MARILIIDDEPQLRKIYSEFLAVDNHQVDTAKDGKHGLTLLAQACYDLVITDIIMPETDGFEVLMALNQKYPRLKKIVITGGSALLETGYLMATAAQLRANKVIAKPVDLTTFRAAIKEVLAQP